MKKNKSNIVLKAIKPVNLTLVVEEDESDYSESSLSDSSKEASASVYQETEDHIALEDQSLTIIDEE